MVDLRKCEDEKSKQHWAFVEATSNIVRRWPRWKVAAAGLCPLCELGLTRDLLREPLSSQHNTPTKSVLCAV